MAIFSRRTIQRLINENAFFTGRKELRTQVDKLNLKKNIPPKEAISAEWEIIILNALSKVGKVLHETDFSGTSKPDICFTINEDSFVADIVSVSDDGKNTQNPAEELNDWLIQTVSKFGFNPNNFELHLGGKMGSKLYKTKTELNIPTLGHINKDGENLLGIEFINFLKEISKSSCSRMIYRDSKYTLAVIYSENSRFSSMKYHSYTEITSLLNNSIFSNLEDKVNQLRKSQSDLPFGIFICDGGCESFKSMSSLHGYSFDDVIFNFLKSYEEILFVFSTTIEQIERNGENFGVKTKIYKGKNYKDLGGNIIDALMQIQNCFPQPQLMPTNAWNIFKSKYSNQGKPFLGCYEIMKNEIKISSRAILELLSGEISQEEFFEIHEFNSPEGNLISYNPFKVFGDRNISKIIVETGENEADDDWLIFKFGDKDASKTKFNLPSI